MVKKEDRRKILEGDLKIGMRRDFKVGNEVKRRDLERFEVINEDTGNKE